MLKVDTRLNNLRDLLHHTGLPPMTGRLDQEEPNLVMRPAQRFRTVQLVGKTTSFDVNASHTQFLPSLGDEVRTTMMEKISLADNINWVPPLRKSQSIKVSMVNRLAEKHTNRRLVNVTLRSVDEYMGLPRHADVKIVLNDPNGQQHMYFARYTHAGSSYGFPTEVVTTFYTN